MSNPQALLQSLTDEYQSLQTGLHIYLYLIYASYVSISAMSHASSPLLPYSEGETSDRGPKNEEDQKIISKSFGA